MSKPPPTRQSNKPLRNHAGSPGTDKLLNVDQVADYLGVSVRTVWAMRSTGELPAFKVGRLTRWRRTDIHRYMAQLPEAR